MSVPACEGEGALPEAVAEEAERQAEVLRETARVGGLASGDDLAVRLKVGVEEAELPPGLLGASDLVRGTVLLAGGLRPSSRQYTICHGLAALHLLERLPGAYHEPFCRRSAAAQLMPRPAFLRSLREHGLDLQALRLRWIHCSYEAIALRVAELCPGVVATAWHWQTERWRRGRPRPEVLAAEEAALGEAYLLPRGVAHVRSGPALAHAWRTQSLPNRAVVLCELAPTLDSEAR